MTKVQKYSLWAAMTLIALVLLPAGVAKLAGVPQMHASFAVLGLPKWFGYFIGTCEIAGAIALFVRPLSVLAAAGISIIMLGALYFHVAHTPIVQGVPALLVLLLSFFVIYRRRAGIKASGA